jgi:hypothetical protein
MLSSVLENARVWNTSITQLNASTVPSCEALGIAAVDALDKGGDVVDGVVDEVVDEVGGVDVDEVGAFDRATDGTVGVVENDESVLAVVVCNAAVALDIDHPAKIDDADADADALVDVMAATVSLLMLVVDCVLAAARGVASSKRTRYKMIREKSIRLDSTANHTRGTTKSSSE